MTQEEKQLLLKDLCARLPYGVKCRQFKLDSQICTLSADLLDKVENIEPYLRPMSSMTDEEYYGEYQRKVLIMRDADETLHWLETVDSIDWLLEHHFDFRGLIEKGLALEAPEGLYKE